MKLLGKDQTSRTLLVALVGGALVIALWLGKPGPKPLAPPAIQAPEVEVVVAQPGNRSLSVETQGTVRPLREIQLVSQVGGVVESVAASFAAGGFFKADEELLKIEDTDYNFAIARAQAQVASARQRVAEERGRGLQAKREWRELGNAQANDLFLRKPQIASAEAALKAAQADLAAAKLDLERTSITAPFNGRVSDKRVDIGQFITPGTHVATVYDTDVAQVRLPLTGRQVALLDLPLSHDDTSTEAFPYPPVVLRADFANKSWEWQGRIVRMDASIDVNSRVIYAVAETDQPFSPEPGSGKPPLYPGSFVNATISGKILPDVSVLPASAVRNDTTVLVVDEQNRAAVRLVEVLSTTADEVWVTGLTKGERVIVSEGARSLAGMEVSVRPLASPQAGATP